MATCFYIKLLMENTHTENVLDRLCIIHGAEWL